jgi:hypothetical protein
MRPLLAFLLPGCISATCVAQVLPAEFDHDRITLVAHAPDGSAVRIYTDSGGGGSMVSRGAASRLKLASAGDLDDDNGTKLTLFEFPAFLLQAGIPAPVKDRGLRGRLMLAPDSRMVGGEMFLGTQWFADHVWRIDYPRHEMALAADFKPDAQDHETPLGFVDNAAGKRQLDFPRITIAVDDKPIAVLLDTGATFVVTPDSASTFQVDPGAFVAGSFVEKTIFDDWHARHPDWKVIEHGDRAASLIEVPHVTVAGFVVGPVWFAMRPDAVWTGMMGPLMDEPIHGAFGGSGLRYFRVVLDYPRAKAWFRLGTDASPAAAH